VLEHFTLATVPASDADGAVDAINAAADGRLRAERLQQA
jgi:hypothetical protein